MKKERLDFLKKHIHELDIDIENGVINNRKIGERPKARYFSIGLHYKNFAVHEVIAVAGGLDILNKTVDHKDGNKKNNRFDNLEAVTQSTNSKRAHEFGVDYTKRKHPPHKISYEQRERIKEMYATGKYTMRTLGDKFGISQCHVHKIIHNELKKPTCISE